MKNQKSNDPVECPWTKFQHTNITINVQVCQVGTTSHMWGGVIRKSRKSHNRQVSYHVYSTYMQTSNQAIRDQKPIKEAQTTLKPRKLHKNWKFFTKNFIKICAKRIYDSPPTHESYNVLIESRGDTMKNKNTKIQKYKIKKTKQNINIYELTCKTKTQPKPNN